MSGRRISAYDCDKSCRKRNVNEQRIAVVHITVGQSEFHGF